MQACRFDQVLGINERSGNKSLDFGKLLNRTYVFQAEAGVKYDLGE